jgi:hypothetical protein
VTARRALPFVAVGAATAAIGLAVVAFVRTRGGAAHHAPPPAAWASAWTKARACLLGSPPASEDVTEAVAAADLRAPKRTCAPELVELATTAGDDAAWTDVRHALGKAADAFTRHLLAHHAYDPDAEDPFPGAFAALESAAAAVRPDVARVPAARHALPALDVLPVLIDGEAVLFSTWWRGAVYVRRGEAEAPYLVRFVAGAPLALPLPTDGSDAVWSPAGTWQTWVDSFDDGRAKVMAATDTAEAITAVASTSGWTSVLAALGEDRERMVIYRDGDGAALARSSNDGRTWRKARLAAPSGGLSVSTSPTGTAVELAWWGDDGVSYLEVTLADDLAARAPEPRSIGPGELVSDCTTGALWIATRNADATSYFVRKANQATELLGLREEPLLLACSPQVLAVSVGERELACTATGCKQLPTIDRYTSTAVVGDQVVRQAEVDDIVAIWWGDAEPVFARKPSHRSVRGILDGGDGKVVILLTREDGMLEYAIAPR